MQTSIFYEARGSKNGVMRFHHILRALCLLTAMLLYDWWYVRIQFFLGLATISSYCLYCAHQICLRRQMFNYYR